MTRSAATICACLATLLLLGCSDPTPPAPTAVETAGDNPIAASTDSETAAAASDPIAYLHDVRTTPRPLHLHTLSIDVMDADLELTTAVGPDPDGDGPAEAILVAPTTLATDHHLIVAINANPFAGMPDETGERPSNWHPGMHVDILGLAARDGQTLSPTQGGYPAIWQTADGRIHMGKLEDAGDETIIAGAAGFHFMLQAGEVTTQEGGPLHPRSAIGIDATGETLYLVVVDGRQDGYSEGMTVHELAVYMKELGAHDAINLDGGGSSILLMARDAGDYITMNRPSRRLAGISFHRPVPILIGLRRPAKPAAADTPAETTE